MPAITSSDDLKNNYNEISAFCHSSSEPVFITQNGKIDLAVMSIEAYEELTSRFELYNTLNEGMEDIASSNTRSFSEVIAISWNVVTDDSKLQSSFYFNYRVRYYACCGLH